MIETELLPNRIKRRYDEAKHIRNLILASCLIAFLPLCIWHFIIKTKMVTISTHIAALQEEMNNYSSLQNKLVSTKRNAELFQRWMQTFNDYQSTTLGLINNLSTIPIRNLCFTEMSRDKNVITFYGYSRSAIDLKEFLMHWSAGNLFSEIKIENLTSLVKEHAVKFQFQAISKDDLGLDLINTEELNKNEV